MLEIDAARIRSAYSRFTDAFPMVEAFYAVKCNPARAVLEVLRTAGSSFEIASLEELKLIAELGVRPQDTLFSNPVRAREQTREAARRGVYRFAADSAGELNRIAAEAPGSSVYVRIATSVEDSVVPSEGKFGVGADTAIELFLLARELSLVPYGVSFHMGSQSLHPSSLVRPLDAVSNVMHRLSEVGVRLHMVNIGGGFPATYDEPVPELSAFGTVAAEALARLPYPVDVMAEPGRCLVAESGTFRCRVLGVARRSSGWWIHTDLGVFNGMMEVLESAGRLRYPMWDSRGSVSRRPYHVTGPTCDSQDTLASNVLLSADLEEGDDVFIGSAGAYTVAYASHFNGFAKPRVVVA